MADQPTKTSRATLGAGPSKESDAERTQLNKPIGEVSDRPAVKTTEPVAAPKPIKTSTTSDSATKEGATKLSAVESVEGVGRKTGTPTGNVAKVGKTIRPTRKARLRLARLDPWSVMKTAFMFSIAAAIIGIVAVGVLWSVVEASGVIEKLQEALNAVLGNADGSGRIQIRSYVDRWRVLGLTTLLSAINVVLITAIATLCAFLYNLTANMLGGIEVTLSEDLN